MKRRKFNKTKEWLQEEYVVKNRPRQEVAKDCGLTVAGLHSILIQYGICKDKILLDEKDIENMLSQGHTVQEIAKKYKCSINVIYRFMKSHNLKTHYTPDYKQYDDSMDDMICSLYLDGFSTIEIGKAVGLTHRGILNHLKHCGIQRRSIQEAELLHYDKKLPKELQEYDLLYNLYIIQRKSKKELGRMFNVDPGTIDTCLHHLNIPVRGSSEAHIGINTGEKHHNWQGEITSLAFRLREAFGVQLVPLVLKRDHYTCQMCGAKGTLHVHHIVHFSTILRQIVSEHPDLDPVDDINELYDIAVQDKRFRDLDNLITYCPHCHYNIAHGKHKE